ncbi:hypothetical protein SD70_23705 [Gordoniibacillus kamchatkensis]|uniref:Uncharacterized protein n=1 Tax=Gordoniibacillus kamchatkensis TaxID=1590651 RepID=A0ABR5AD19_9BACL|nr:hypothetical protein [Paenibacillus sp. VKM B-2647]KIL38871.1 hypothetical protein SD70_23705 [Paenibacillus sp. VKM B-2647]
MYKLLLFPLMAVCFFALYALQTDEELAMFTLFHGKRALNYAVHAAAQQSDMDKLADGVRSIDPIRAQAAARDYLRANLRLDANNDPLPGTLLRNRVEWLDWAVINENNSFPYTYTNNLYGYSVTLHKPGVVAIVRLQFPRSYTVLQPIAWTIKAAAEITY